MGARVAIASSGLGHVARGVEAWAADLGRALHDRGVDVRLYKGGGRADAPYEQVVGCAQRGSWIAKRFTRILPRSLAWRLHLASAYGVEQVTFAFNLILRLRLDSIDLLHVQDPVVALIVQRAHACGLIRTHTILAHGTEESLEFLNKITHIQHLAPWHEVQCRNAGVSKPGWTSIPNFIDTNRFAPGRCNALRAELGIPEEALVVLTAAAIKSKHKRIDVFLDEFALLLASDPGVPAWLVIAGGKEADTDELVARGRERLGDRVRFLVRFPRERMADLYRCADIFVLNSLKEMMPIALLEAIASGLPCIVHDHPVLQWMVGPGGKTADLSTPGTLAQEMQSLLNDVSHRRRLGELGRQHCLAQFGENAVVGRILEFYKHVQTDASVPATPFDATSTHNLEKDPRVIPSAPESVSVVIPTFNSAQWVTQAVESVLAQSVPPVEIFVIDDGSTDDTRQKLAPYYDRIRYILQSNSGVAQARNHGIRLATGSLIAFLDADDVWHPRKLELQLAALAAHPQLVLVGSAVKDWPTVSTEQWTASPEGLDAVSWRQLAVRNRFTTSTVVVRRAALESVGGFDTALHGPEDYDLWLRIAEKGATANLRSPLTGYRTVPGSLGRRVNTMEAGLRRILKKLDERKSWRGRWLLRRKAHSYYRYSCAFQHMEAGNHAQALQRLLSSLATYPMPYRRSEVRMSLARLRMLAAIVARLHRAPEKPRTA